MRWLILRWPLEPCLHRLDGPPDGGRWRPQLAAASISPSGATTFTGPAELYNQLLFWKTSPVCLGSVWKVGM